MNEEHSFNVEVAKIVGVNAAILIKSINWWCRKNAANGRHYHDGLYWSYNTISAFCELYPYLGKSAISRALKKLEDGGYIKTGNFNNTSYDRTRWYAITQAGAELCEVSAHFSKREMEESKREMEKSKRENRNEQSETTIPVANQLLSSSLEPDRVAKPKSRRFEPPTLDEAKAYASEMGYQIDVDHFIDYYTANGWVQGRGKPIKDWKAALRNWAKNDRNFHPEKEDKGDYSKYDDFMFGKGSRADGDAQ